MAAPQTHHHYRDLHIAKMARRTQVVFMMKILEHEIEMFGRGGGLPGQ
jgi:hypothetical protein